MTILEKIIAAKHVEVKELRERIPVSILQKSKNFQRKTISLADSVLNEHSAGVIAEFKRKSPSAGIMNREAAASVVALEYCYAGASAISVLTDSTFFGGSVADLAEVRSNVNCAVLRKDFIIDEYQIIEARSAGADAILLISEVLSAQDLQRFHKLATSLGMEVIVEIHEKKNIDLIPAETCIIGINNRNLATLDFTLSNSEELITMLPGRIVKVAESGIRSPSDYVKMKKAGFQGFLIGEYFMKSRNPGLSCAKFIKEIHEFKN